MTELKKESIKMEQDVTMILNMLKPLGYLINHDIIENNRFKDGVDIRVKWEYYIKLKKELTLDKKNNKSIINAKQSLDKIIYEDTLVDIIQTITSKHDLCGKFIEKPGGNYNKEYKKIERCANVNRNNITQSTTDVSFLKNTLDYMVVEIPSNITMYDFEYNDEFNLDYIQSHNSVYRESISKSPGKTEKNKITKDHILGMRNIALCNIKHANVFKPNYELIIKLRKFFNTTIIVPKSFNNSSEFLLSYNDIEKIFEWHFKYLDYGFKYFQNKNTGMFISIEEYYKIWRNENKDIIDMFINNKDYKKPVKIIDRFY